MTKETFASLFEESLGENKSIIGTVVKGTVISTDSESVLIDVGLKSEGRVPLKEFMISGTIEPINTGDTVDIYIENMENKNGEISLSRERAKREEAWIKVEKMFEDKQHIEGIIFGRVKGGFTVDVLGAIAFLPGSQLDIKPIRDVDSLMNIKQTFEILKMDKERGNIVVSRRSILEETSMEERAKIIKELSEGQIIDGIVKNITDYGAFVDLGGIDGLLHITDISWKRINHPSEVLKIGETIKTQIISFNKKTNRISLGIKQMADDPWKNVANKYTTEGIFSGTVTNITDYGAFIELEEGIEGLVHISEMSWTKKNIHPGKIVSTSEKVDVKILELDADKRRISLGIKQCYPNPWEKIANEYHVNTTIEGKIKNITEFGIFVGITEDIDGMVHISDISWDKSNEEALKEYRKGDMVKVIILDLLVDKERISLGIKQLTKNENSNANLGEYKKGDVVTATVTKINNNGIEVTVGEDSVAGFIKKADLSIDKSEQRTDKFAIDEKLDAKITSVSKNDNRLNLSIKTLEIAQEKEAVEQYGSTDSGATLGDILGKALDK